MKEVSKVIRYGIIGYGNQGTKYYKWIKLINKKNKYIDVTAICDNRQVKIDQIKENCKDVEVFDDYKKMIASGLVDAILVETPHYQHPEIVTYCLEHNMPVLCDKPAGVFTKAVREEIEVAKKHDDVLFGILYNQRTNPLYLKAKEIIESGKLGKIKRLVWIITDWYRPQAYYNQGGWRGTWNGEGGGVLLNQAPHQIDLITWLVGLPTSVMATTSTVNRDISVENDVTCYFKLKDGGTGVFITSTHDAPGTNRLEIDGDGGKIVIEGNTMQFTQNEIMEPEYSKTNVKDIWGQPARKTIKYNKIKMYLKSKYLPEHFGIIKNFADVLIGKDNFLLSPGVEGINGLTLSNAIHLSGWLHKEISIPFDEDLFISELNKRKEEEIKADKYHGDY